MIDRGLRLIGRRDGTNGAHEGVLPQSLTVCLVTEGTYPYFVGGVSTWCDMLIRGLPEVRFVLMSLVPDPGVVPAFKLPANVVALIPVPLWGIENALEMRRDLGLRAVIRSKRQPSWRVIQLEFLPLFQQFLRVLWSPEARPDLLGLTLSEMADYFAQRDYDGTMRSRLVWNCFVQEGREGYVGFLRRLGCTVAASLCDLTEGMRLLYRWLAVLTIPIPEVDLIHTAAAGLCSLIGIVARQKLGIPFLLSEHGVYLRERLLALIRPESSFFSRLFQAQFAQRFTEASYYFADQIAPCSNYNHRWELRHGADPRRICTIYNGSDPQKFAPLQDYQPIGTTPTIVWVGRIDPLKDLETLIRAAAIVHREMPEARFVLYGKAPKGNEQYYESCLALRDELGLQQTVIFAGFAANPEAAYNEGDFVILSSISEGFPYTVVEAMMCGRTVVGTAVGGVPEALEGCGLVVEPRNPEEMAAACLRLLKDPDLTRELGRKAREKALAHFSLQKCNAAFLETYRRLTIRPNDALFWPDPRDYDARKHDERSLTLN